MTAYVLSSDEKDPRKIIFFTNQLAQGRSNAPGAFTLAAGATTTTVAAQNCASGSQVVITPKSANAAAAAATTWVSAVANGSFTVTHASAASTDRTFGYVALG